jgi:quinol monooxygenase YgiN
MAIYQTGGYQVKSSAVNKVKQAIKEFVHYVQKNEPGTKMYLAWQQKSDPTRFLHLFIFEDAAAQTRHGQSEAVKRFESVYSSELVGGDVVFTDYELVSGKPTAEQWALLLTASKPSASTSQKP